MSSKKVKLRSTVLGVVVRLWGVESIAVLDKRTITCRVRVTDALWLRVDARSVQRSAGLCFR